jgi:uncharacterized protein (UPF0332 family)
VTPNARAGLDNARRELEEARAILAIGLAHVAARSAYYATFHAAEAAIAEATGRVVKTHAGVRSLFSRIARENGKLGTDLGKILAQGYNFKEISDYGTDPRTVVSREDAEDMIILADRFVQRVEAALC